MYMLFPAETHAFFYYISCLYNNCFSIHLVFCLLINNSCQSLLKQSKVPLSIIILGNLPFPFFRETSVEPSEFWATLDWLLPWPAFQLSCGISDLITLGSPFVYFPCWIPFLRSCIFCLDLRSHLEGQLPSSFPRKGVGEGHFLRPCISENICVPPSHLIGN